MPRGKTNPFPTFQFALLGLLQPGPTYGYELHKQLSDESGIGLIWQVKLSNLYAVLEQLEKKDWLTVTLVPGDTRPGRKVYQITAAGRSAFAEWLDAPVIHPREFRQDFMVKFYFHQSQKPESIATFLRVQLGHCRTWLKNVKTLSSAPASDSGFQKSVIRFRKSQIQSMVDWLEKELEHIERQNPIYEVLNEEK